jgi:hypothetical protein
MPPDSVPSAATAEPKSEVLESREDRSPLSTVLLWSIGATLVVFFCLLPLYARAPIMVWAWKHWLPNLNQEYGKLVIPLSLLLVWYHRRRIRSAPKNPSNLGLIFLGAGFFFVLLGTRAMQPRITMLAIPTLIFGVVLFLWGKAVARVLLFPIGFLGFMIPAFGFSFSSPKRCNVFLIWLGSK